MERRQPDVTRLINESTLVNMGPSVASGLLPRAGQRPAQPLHQYRQHLVPDPARSAGPPPQQFQYLDEGEAVDGAPTTGVKVRVGSENIEWTWNPDDRRSSSARSAVVPHDDKVFGRIGATNVVVMGVQYDRSAADRNSPEAQTIGEGPDLVFTDGQVVRARWKRDNGFYSIDS